MSLKRTDGKNNTVYVDRLTKEIHVEGNPYGPCGRRPMSCESINLRSFRRYAEPWITNARLKKCRSRQNHPYYKCATELDNEGNFVKCKDVESRSLPSSKPSDVIPVSHRMPSPAQSVRSSLKTAVQSNNSKKSKTQRSAPRSPKTFPIMRKRSKSKSPPVRTDSSDSVGLIPYSERKYVKMYVGPEEVEDFFVAIQFYLYSIGIEKHPMLNDPSDVRRESRMVKKQLTDRNLNSIASFFDVSIYVWNFDTNNETWDVYGNPVESVVKVVLFKEDDRYGYLQKKTKPKPSSATTTRRSSGRTQKEKTI